MPLGIGLEASSSNRSLRRQDLAAPHQTWWLTKEPRLIGCGAAGGSAGNFIELVAKLIVSQGSLPAPPDLDLAAVEPGAYVVMSPEHHGSGTSTFEDSAAWRQWEAGDLMLLPPKGAFVFISDYTIVLIALERLLL